MLQFGTCRWLGKISKFPQQLYANNEGRLVKILMGNSTTNNMSTSVVCLWTFCKMSVNAVATTFMPGSLHVCVCACMHMHVCIWTLPMSQPVKWSMCEHVCVSPCICSNIKGSTLTCWQELLWPGGRATGCSNAGRASQTTSKPAAV